MPSRKQFASNEEYNKWFREYRVKNISKLREYGKEYNCNYRAIHGYKNERNWKKNNPEKVKAHHLLRYAVRIGIVIKKPCEICGDINSMGHHADYNKPLEVMWLCSKHHKEIHAKLLCA